MVREFTQDERSRGGQKGGKRRLETVSVARRKEIATMAVWMREAKRLGWTPITVESTDLDQINQKLVKLQALEAKAWSEGDDDKVLRCIAASFPWFSKRVQLTWLMAARMGPAVDIDDTTSKRLEEARERREKAMEGEDKK
jgi:hypothetical protein